MGIKVLDEYSSEELTRIELECSEGNYRLEEDFCYAEVFDPRTKQNVKDGQGAINCGGDKFFKPGYAFDSLLPGRYSKIETEKNVPAHTNGRVITQIEGRGMDAYCPMKGDFRQHFYGSCVQLIFDK
ncbi:MAG: hypothetical protein LBH37_03620 [Oscillospiraceae bacterium]|nr:hypothetical protein [Oscillospiraceae bacterium]